MTPEEMKFYLDVLASPAVVTFAGGLLGACVTLGATWFKNRHDAKESDKAWRRAEERRKEERNFENKNMAYKNFINICKNTPWEDIQKFDANTMYSLLEVIIYSPKNVSEKARLLSESLLDIQACGRDHPDFNNKISNIGKNSKLLYDEIYKDISDSNK